MLQISVAIVQDSATALCNEYPADNITPIFCRPNEGLRNKIRLAVFAPTGSLGPYTRAAPELQDQLGLFNDFFSAAELVNSLSAARRHYPWLVRPWRCRP